MKNSAALLTVGWLLTALYAPGASAQPTRISECQRIDAPGSYILSRNLTAAGDCLAIAADFVTVDLAGFTIAGNRTGSGIRDAAGQEPRLGIAVRNGTITGFVNGVNLRNTAGAVVEGIRTVGPAPATEGVGIGIGGGIGGSGDGIVSRNTVLDYVTGIGARGGVVSGNSVAGNATGMEVFTAVVEGNSAKANDFFGIVAQGSSVLSNTAQDNGIFPEEHGGIIAVAPGSTLTGNTSSVNEGDGIFADRGSTVSRNTATDNTDVGIEVFCPSAVIENTAARNRQQFDIGRGCQTQRNL